MKNFKLFDGKEIEDLGDYVLEYYALHPDVKIYIGTDSAQHGKLTKYATVVSFLHPKKGVHVIFKRLNVPRVRDMFTRLWNEVEYTLEVANYVHDTLSDVYDHKANEMIPILHLDFNKKPKYKSNIVHDLSIGYLKGFGYKVYSKPESWVASHCADALVRN